MSPLELVQEVQRRRDVGWRTDPVAFAGDRGLKCDPWQIGVLRSRAPRMLLNCSRQSGKSTVASFLARHTAEFNPGSLVLVVSPTQRQSGELFIKIKSIASVGGAKPIEDSKTSLVLSNGSRIVSLPGSEANIRGFSGTTLLIEDEASRVPDDLYRSIRPMLAASKGRLVLMSTPFGKRGHFYNEWEKGDDWERFRIPATECPRIPTAFLESERKSLGEWWYKQEYCCEFGDTIDGVFRGADVEQMIANDIYAVDLFGDSPVAYDVEAVSF